MKTRLTAVTYLGFTGMDKRFSTSMLPWLLKEIRATGTRDKLSVAVEDGCLKAYNGNFEPVIIHRLVDILRASQVPGHPEELFYILHNEKEGLLNCYLFRANSDTEVTDLFAQMREPSPGARGSQGSLAGAVTRNAGFQADSAEHLPWHAPAAPQACYTGLNSSAGGAGGLVRSVSNASALTSLCADLSPSDSHFFEVLYIGKVRISQRKVPESLIDDALNKFAQHEAGKALQRRHSLLSSCGTSVYSSESSENLDEKNGESNFKIQPSTSPLEPAKNTAWKSTDNLRKNDAIDKEFDMFSKERVKKPQVLEPNVLIINVPGKNNLGTLTEDEEKHEELGKVISETASSITQFCQEKLQSDDYGDKKEGSERTEEKEETEDKDPLTSAVEVKGSEGEKENPSQSKPQSLNFDEISRKPQMNRLKDTNRPMPDNKPFLRDRSASIGSLTLKTPITHMIGEQNRTMLFQVGRAELRLISPDRKQVLLQRAFRDVASCVLGRHSKDHFGFVCRENTTDAYACYVFKCESDSVALEVINAIKQAFVAHSELLKKSREKSPNMTCEHCPMLWYHRLCHDAEGMNEKKTHAFILRRIEQLPEDEQDLIVTKYQGGTNHMYEVSEHNAFLMMLLRAHCEAKQQRHVHDTAENRSEFLNQYLGGSTIFMKAKRSLSSGFDHLLKRRASRDDGNLMPVKNEPSPLPEPADPSLLSPDSARGKSLSPATGISDVSPSVIAESSPEEDPEEPPVKDEGTPVNSPMMDIFLKVSDNRPNHTEAGPEPEATWRQAIYEKVLHSDTQGEGELSSSALLPRAAEPPRAGRRSREQLRQLWKLAIQQTVLLVRMERENAKLKENEESSALRRIKLEYSELSNCDAGVTSVWERLLAEPAARVDRHMLTQAVRQGVPRVSRGAVWYFLAEQHGLRAPPPDTRRCPRYHAPYRALLAGLTKHQHAILIDLGRTFPKHGYFAAALGPGQLALYNTLKAYSLLDPEVGYCQGLSFVAGVLLLHMEEQEAFILLRHLMFRRGLRKQYLPDMSALQVQLYQLSRLVRDLEPELHAHLERLDVSAALYAAPWMLTLFTSQFPLGFVVRVFDLIFLDSLDVVFSVSIALLSAHKDGLMLCENCEEAAEYLKHKLPDISKNTYDKVMKTVHSLDISRQLSDYAVEYSVLRDQLPRLWALSETNRALQDNARTMTEQLDSAMDAINNYQKTVTRLESQNKSMDQQLALLSRYVTAHHKQDMPAEIKKIVQNYSKKISFSSKILRLASNEEEEEKDTKKLYKTGQSAPNLFAKISREDVLNAVNKEKNKSPERDRRHFLMKKSQSVQSGLIATNLKQYPLKVLEEKEYKRSDSFQTDMLKESLKEIGKSNSGFFANTHELIRQERMFEQQLKHDFDQNLKKLDEKIEPKSYMDDLSIFQSRKTMSLNIKSASDKGDSGFVTPLSPKDRKEHFKREDSDRKDDSCSIISHPLSDCDVDIKFDGHSTKLKQIRPLRNNSSVGLDAKQM